MELLSSKSEAQKLRAMVAIAGLASVAYNASYDIHPDSREQLIKAIKSCTSQPRYEFSYFNLSNLIDREEIELSGEPDDCLFFNIAISYLVQKDESIDENQIANKMKLIKDINAELEEVSL